MFEPKMKTANVSMSGILAMLGIFAGTLPPAIAEEASQSYQMLVIENDAFGDLIVEGDYESAIRNNLQRRTHQDVFALKNNLCVAFTMAGQLEEAADACDSAITANRRSSSPWAPRRKDSAWQAIAYSNRGVLRLVQGDKEAARKDFAQAAALKGSADGTSVDLTRLNSLDR